METLTLGQLRATTDAGGVAGVTLTAQGSSFYVQVETRSGGEAILAKARSSEPRGFGNPAQALALLHGLGLAVGSFDMKNWNPDDRSTARTRPDRAEALRQTHEAAGYDRWFRGEVEQGLTEADDPETKWVTNEEAEAGWEKKRAALLKRSGGESS